MAIIPTNDEELARKRLRTEGRPIADQARRNQAMLAMSNRGQMPSAASQVAGSRLRGEAARAMSGNAGQIGSEIYQTRTGQEFQRGQQERGIQANLESQQRAQAAQGVQFGSEGNVTRSLADIQRGVRGEQYGLQGFQFGADGKLGYTGQVVDPKTGEMVSAETFQETYGRPPTMGDVQTTQSYLQSQLQEQVSAFDPKAREEEIAEQAEFYQQNPSSFVRDQFDIAFGGKMGTEYLDRDKLTQLFSGDTPDWSGIYQEVYRSLRKKYDRGATLQRIDSIIANLKKSWETPTPMGSAGA